jgi:hypothetical protein
MLVSAGLLLAGAAVNAVGISSGVAVQVSDRREQAAAAPAEGTGEGA